MRTEKSLISIDLDVMLIKTLFRVDRRKSSRQPVNVHKVSR